MEDKRIPKDILYEKLASGKRHSGCPQLRFKDACIGDMKALDINTGTWEDFASNRSDWRSTLRTQLVAGEKVLAEKAAEKPHYLFSSVRVVIFGDAFKIYKYQKQA